VILSPADVTALTGYANPFAGTEDPNNPSQLRYDLTLDDLQESGQSFSASVLDAPAATWGTSGKF
jgi:hypothetical protein